MKKLSAILLTLLAIMLAASLAFATPSGAITDDARDLYTQALEGAEEDYEEEEDEGDEEARIVPRAVIASTGLSDIQPSDEVFLPVDLFEPGSEPIAENFTEDGYEDETISVHLEKTRMYDSDVFIAYVKIASPTQFRTAIAGTKMSKEKTSGTSQIAASYNAIIAVNGDYYLKNKAGYITRMGQTYREKAANTRDMMLVDQYGDIHLCKKGTKLQKAFVEEFQKEYTIINGFLFGPALIIDGVVQTDLADYGAYEPAYQAPRAGIAQLDTLTYAIVVVNGRTDNSPGINLTQFADIMNRIGAKQAFNLDGGNSATLAFNGAVYNDKPQKERGITDIIYFASAIESK